MYMLTEVNHLILNNNVGLDRKPCCIFHPLLQEALRGNVSVDKSDKNRKDSSTVVVQVEKLIGSLSRQATSDIKHC